MHVHSTRVKLWRDWQTEPGHPVLSGDAHALLLCSLFKHGQSGVAPNAIELHPILSILFRGATAPPILPVNPAPPTRSTAIGPQPSGSFAVCASVSPNPVSYGSYPTLYAYSSPGAVCMASVLYSTGRAPVSFNGSAQTVGGSGVESTELAVAGSHGLRSGPRASFESSARRARTRIVAGAAARSTRDLKRCLSGLEITRVRDILGLPFRVSR